MVGQTIVFRGLPPRMAADKNRSSAPLSTQSASSSPKITMLYNEPSQLIEGILIAGRAIDAHKGYIYIRGEYRYLIDVMDRAIAEAYTRGYLGKNIQGTG